MIESELVEIAEENGILIDDFEMSIMEYIPDSITFITFIVAIEEKFDIEMPDDFLLIEKFGSIKELATVINDIRTSK
ncbi:MAG: acyl carrier protein [Bacilli bacterium]|nr:acyl carrier protein [Bacilli bacterium]